MKAGGYLLAGMVGGIIGFVWTGVIFIGGMYVGYMMDGKDTKSKKHECKCEGECGCQK